MANSTWNRQLASNRTSLAEVSQHSYYNVPDSIPGLVTDSESDSEADADLDVQLQAMANSTRSHTEQYERQQVVRLVLQVTSDEITKRTGGDFASVYRFVRALVQRSGVTLTQFLTNLVILRRVYASSRVSTEPRMAVLLSFVLGEMATHGTASIDFARWQQATGVSRQQLTTELVTLGRALGGLGEVKTVSDEDLHALNRSLKTEVKRHVKVY